MSGEKSEWDSEVFGRVRIFVLNYCTDSLCFCNGTKAYKQAYTKIVEGKAVYIPSDEVSATSASRLLRNVKVKKSIALLLKETQAEADRENGYRLLHDLFLQATFNPADIIDKRGQLRVKDLSELGDLAKCIASIEPSLYGAKVKLINRAYAQEKLLRYYKLASDGNTVKLELPVIDAGGKLSIDEWNEENADEIENEFALEATEKTTYRA